MAVEKDKLIVGVDVPIAEQLAIVVYYCLAIGTVKEVWALRTARQAKTADDKIG
jgi:hypothetical protein